MHHRKGLRSIRLRELLVAKVVAPLVKGQNLMFEGGLLNGALDPLLNFCKFIRE